MPISRDDCARLDRADPLADARERFVLPSNTIYLDGNSLGALPKGVAEHTHDVVTKQWGEGLIRSWNGAGWWESPGRIGAKLAPLLGAAAHQVTIVDTISINLFKALSAAVRMRPGRETIVAEQGNFPSDNHMIDSVARLFGLKVKYVPTSELAVTIDRDTAVVELSHVNYRTAEIQDMRIVTAAAHASGALIVWDLAHSTGAVELNLDRDLVDFAVGCGYKFLNGGPGAPAHIYVADRHLKEIDQPLAGWWGHNAPFAFGDKFERAKDIRSMLCSTAPMLSMLAFEKALDAFDGLKMSDVHAKGRALGDLMIKLYDEKLATLGFGLAVSRDGAKRGHHVSITHTESYRMMQALIARGVVGDFRAPDVMRFGFGPLYVRFTDIFDAVDAIKDVAVNGAWKKFEAPKSGAVT